MQDYQFLEHFFLSRTQVFTFARTVFAVVTASVNVLRATFTGATIGATTLKVVLRGLMSLTIGGAAIVALSFIINRLTGYFEKSAASADLLTAAEKQQSSQAEELAVAHKQRTDKVNNAVSSLIAKYQELKSEWGSLKTKGEQTDWISKNQSAFSDLGLSVKKTNDAYNYFVKNSDRVIAALTAIAEADAWKDIYKEDVKREQLARRNKNTSNGGYYYVVHHKAGERLQAGDYDNYGLNEGDVYYQAVGIRSIQTRLQATKIIKSTSRTLRQQPK